MALLPPFFLDAVGTIGVREQSGNVSWLATGFLVGRPVNTEKGEDAHHVFFVTNRHVFSAMDDGVVRLSAADGASPKVGNLRLKENGRCIWAGHPDPDIDVAVVSLDAGKLAALGVDIRFIQEDANALTRAQMKADGVCEGDTVFVLGFPMGMVAEHENAAIVRGGTLARIRDTLAGHSNTFLVDAEVFPGNSGGPVVNRPEFVAITSTKAPQKSSLIGIVAAYHTYKDVAVSRQSGQHRVTFVENSGLAIVYPVDFIKETIDHWIKTVPPARVLSDVVPASIAPPPAS